jgi:lipopolysaccharide exporter
MKLKRAPGSFVKHVGTLVTGTGFAQAVTLAGTLILARLFAPDAFGLLALYVTLVSFLSVLGGGRYELAIMLPETDAEAANVLYLSVVVAMGISLFCLVLVALVRVPVASLLGDPRMANWLWSVPAVLFISDAYQSLNYWCGRMKQFRRLAFSRVFQAIGTVACQLLLFALHVSSGFALIGGYIFGQLLATVLLLVQVLASEARFLIVSYNPKSIRSTLKEYRNFPFYKAPYSFISNAASQLVFVVLRVFSSLHVVGLYSLASRAIYLPVNLIAASMNQVFYEKAATELKEGRLEDFVTRVLRVQILLATPVLVFVAFEARLLFGEILGSKWAAGGAYVVWLACAGYMYFLTSWLDRVFDVRGRQRLSLGLEFAGNAASLGALVVTLMMTGNSVHAVAAFSVSEVLYSIVWLCTAYHVAGFRVKSLWTLAQDALISAVSVAALFLLIAKALHPWPWVRLAVVVSLLGAALVFSFVRYVRGGYAFSSTAERFHKFWSDKTTCLNHCESPEFYAAQGRELQELLAKRHHRSVLEIGCGEGSLFKHLHFGQETYRGVDFSSHFLEKFRSQHPGVELECAEGASYCRENQTFDLILSNGVVQHFDPEMLARHVENARKMMHSGSELVWGCVLDKNSRALYESGAFGGANGSGWTNLVKARIRRFLGLDAMGFWYEQKEIAALAQKYGLGVRFSPSKLYPYRFHAILTIADHSGKANRSSAEASQHAS